MNHLHLLIPDLFPPQEIAAEVCAGLRLPALQKLLSRGQTSVEPATSLEGWLCSAFGVQAVAPVRAAADGLDASEGYWLCADPVNLQLHRAQMILIPEVVATQVEAAALCDDLNAHFAGQGMRFFAPHSQRWYVQLQQEPQLKTAPLQEAAWQDARFHQPQGADTLYWQRVMTEVQMLLHAHAANRAREAHGILLISSLWLWGGGRAEQVGRPFDVCGGDSVLAAAFARVAGMAQAGAMQAMLGGSSERGLWVWEGLRDAKQRGDFARWRELVLLVEADCVLLLRALQAGRLQRLTLEVLSVNGAQRFEATRASVWKLWRPVRALPRYAV